MKISYWPDNAALNSQPAMKTLLEAVSKTDTLVENTIEADATIIWSVLWYGRMAKNKRAWDEFRKRNKPVIVLEVGGLVRNNTWRLSINGINRTAIFPTIEKYDVDRPAKLGLDLLPWHDGEYILICGQHGFSEQWANMPPMDQYYKETVEKIRKYSDKPIVIRSHPRFRERIHFKVDEKFYTDRGIEWNSPKKVVKTYDNFDLEPLLSHCHAVVSQSSNSGITAIRCGTPAIVGTESLAYPVATNDFAQIATPPTPDRNNWLVELSHKEWLLDELQTNSPWLALRENLVMVV